MTSEDDTACSKYPQKQKPKIEEFITHMTADHTSTYLFGFDDNLAYSDYEEEGSNSDSDGISCSDSCSDSIGSNESDTIELFEHGYKITEKDICQHPHKKDSCVICNKITELIRRYNEYKKYGFFHYVMIRTVEPFDISYFDNNKCISNFLTKCDLTSIFNFFKPKTRSNPAIIAFFKLFEHKDVKIIKVPYRPKCVHFIKIDDIENIDMMKSYKKWAKFEKSAVPTLIRSLKNILKKESEKREIKNIKKTVKNTIKELYSINYRYMGCMAVQDHIEKLEEIVKHLTDSINQIEDEIKEFISNQKSYYIQDTKHFIEYYTK
jgi:hypothetical protein